MSTGGRSQPIRSEIAAVGVTPSLRPEVRSNLGDAWPNPEAVSQRTVRLLNLRLGLKTGRAAVGRRASLGQSVALNSSPVTDVCGSLKRMIPGLSLEHMRPDLIFLGT